jgi:pimeloyl-ACP methyl ester carboxylesterase
VFGIIDGYANQLRAQGAQRIVVGGTSLGANVALAYAVARQSVAGVVMAGPWAQSPRLLQPQPVDQGGHRAGLPDGEVGPGQPVLLRPRRESGKQSAPIDHCGGVLRLDEPARPGQHAGQLPANIPLMLIIGTKDPAFGFAEANIYQPAAKNPYSKYLVIGGGEHRNTEHSASQRIIDWIKGLP